MAKIAGAETERKATEHTDQRPRDKERKRDEDGPDKQDSHGQGFDWHDRGETTGPTRDEEGRIENENEGKQTAGEAGKSKGNRSKQGGSRSNERGEKRRNEDKSEDTDESLNGPAVPEGFAITIGRRPPDKDTDGNTDGAGRQSHCRAGRQSH